MGTRRRFGFDPHPVATSQPARGIQKHRIQRIATHFRKQRLERTFLTQVGNDGGGTPALGRQPQSAARTRLDWLGGLAGQGGREGDLDRSAMGIPW